MVSAREFAPRSTKGFFSPCTPPYDHYFEKLLLSN